MLNPDALFARNMTFAGSVKYDLERVHGFAVAESLSVCLRTTAAFYEDDGKVLLVNVPERAKSINEFTLLITSIGELIFFALTIK